MSDRTVIGVDPGGRYTGVVARRRDRLLYGCTVSRETEVPGYVAEVVDTVHKARALAPRDDVVVVAVEGLNPPSPHLGMTNLLGLIDCAQVLGAVIHAFPDALVVLPNRHGAGPLRAYPEALVGATEVVGTGKRRHLRSAWDVAGAAQLIRPTNTKGAPPCPPTATTDTSPEATRSRP